MRMIIALAVVLSSSPAFAAEPFEKFCEEVPSWAVGSQVPNEAKYVENKVGQPITAKAAAESLAKPDWILVDARSDADRSSGKIPKAVLMTSDSKDAAKHEFKKEIIEKRLGEAFKAKGQSLASFADLKTKHVAIFCNGPACHRTTFAACTLRKMGVPYENLHLILGGFNEWKAAGLPVR